MIIEFNKKKNFYDYLTIKLYKSEISNTICNNFIPIIINEEHFILTSSKNLEGYLIDYRDNIGVKIYINNINEIGVECIDLILNNVVVFGSISIPIPLPNTNCYIDTINNLLLIKFNSSKLNYIKINNNLDSNNDLRFDEEKIRLKYVWTDENLNQRTLNKFTKIINIW